MAWLAATIDRLKASLTAQRGEAAALPAYDAIVTQARQPAFYKAYGVPDSPQGRFELVLLHAILLMRRLPDKPQFNQQLFDLMFADFDIGLRELGIGDLGVGKRVHSWAAAFRGRAAVYAAALHDTDQRLERLAAALSRNVYAQRAAVDEGQRLARYVMTVDAGLTSQSTHNLVAGEIHWPQPEEIA